MNKEEAVLALYTLGCSREEIDDLMHTEYLRRKKHAIAEIVREMELKTDKKRMDEDEKKKERAMMEEGLYITVKEV